jgi:hypothetical protein
MPLPPHEKPQHLPHAAVPPPPPPLPQPLPLPLPLPKPKPHGNGRLTQDDAALSAIA